MELTGNKKTVFSGVQPSGILHLGNYLGALTQWREMQEQYNCLFCVVDYHAITVRQKPVELGQQIIDTVKMYLAAGINPEKCVIFQQSDITAHTELAWILNCITKNGDLTKMTQFKSKSGVQLEDSENTIFNLFVPSKYKNNAIEYTKDILKEANYRENPLGAATKLATIYFKDTIKLFNSVGVGLFDYPVLMAADILLYNTDLVPVGDDQAQHVELTRTLAQRFNRDYGQVFKIPAVAVRKQGARIMGLDDPTKKMSKSASSPANYIALTDAPEVAVKKIKRAVTDSGQDIKYDVKNKPAISNLLTIYSLLTGDGFKELEVRYRGRGYGNFKQDLAEVVKGFLSELQVKYYGFKDEEVKEILRVGAEQVRPVAEETIKKVKEKIGIN